MPKSSSPLQEVIDLSELSPEEQQDLLKRMGKASRGTQTNKGFQTILKTLGAGTGNLENPVSTPGDEEGASNQPPLSSSPPSESVAIESEAAVESIQPNNLEGLADLVQQAIAQSLEPIQNQLTASQQENQELRDQLNQANQQVEASRQNNDAVAQLSQLLGLRAQPEKGQTVEMPNVNTKISPNRDQLTGRLAEFFQVRDSLGVQYRTTKNGTPIPCYEANRLDAWVAQNGCHNKTSSAYIQLMNEMTDWGKKHGLFRGSRMITEAEMRSATTGANIPGGFLEILSSIMRVSARPGLIYWQFPQTVHRYDRGEGEVVDIPRAAYPDIPEDPNERLLSGSGTYYPIDNSNTAVNTGIVKFQLNEYGRGRSGAPPIAIPTFVEMFSMIPLMTILERDLFWDYYHWEDLIIRKQWEPTSVVYYNNNDRLATAASSVSSGGQLTRKFLGELRVQASNERMVPLPDGNYGLATNPTACQQLKNDYDKYWETPSPEAIRALTNMMLSQYPTGENIKLSGYKGLHEGVHIWETNGYANGAPGTPGVTAETDGQSGTSNFRESYFFGGFASGRGMGGNGAQILYDENNDFGRITRAIWHSYETHGPVDVDAVGYNDTQRVPQETRVWKVRTADEAVTA